MSGETPTMRYAMHLAVVFAVLNFVNALPFLQLDAGSRELLAARDTAYYGFPLIWYKRPFYDNNDDEVVNAGQFLDWKQRSSTISYINVGSAWGR